MVVVEVAVAVVGAAAAEVDEEQVASGTVHMVETMVSLEVG